MLLGHLEVQVSCKQLKFGLNPSILRILSLGNPRGPLGLSQAGRLTLLISQQLSYIDSFDP